MASKSRLKSLLWLVFLIIGFIAGAAWKSTDTDSTGTADVDNAELANYAAEETSTNKENITALNPTELATIRLFEKAAPSVCFITTSNVRRDFFTRDISEIPRGTGSGFIWDKQGHIVTNYHVIQGADRAQVTLSDRTTWQAKLVGVAPEKDLAVLKIDLDVKASLPLPLGSSDNLRVGQSVYAIGNPFGLDQTLTTGIVSALGREIQSVAGIPIRDVIQTDAAINPGNSGGPLLDSSGRLIGVNTAIYSPSGASAGIGFSIPVDVVNWVVPELIKYGRLKRPSLGVETARQSITKRLGLEGALVIDVIPGSAADKAGIQPTYRDRYGAIQLGDIIIGVNEEQIKNSNDLLLALERYQEGELITVKLIRDNNELELTVNLDPPR